MVGFSFNEVGCLHSRKSKVLSSHFSSDGKVLVSAGHEKKVIRCNKFSNSSFVYPFRIIATSSFDRSVRLWDAARVSCHLSHLSWLSLCIFDNFKSWILFQVWIISILPSTCFQFLFIVYTFSFFCFFGINLILFFVSWYSQLVLCSNLLGKPIK